MNRDLSGILRAPLRAMVWTATLVTLAFQPLRAQTNETDAADPANRPPAPRRPNIVLIVADNVGYGDLGAYGQTRIKTPHLDALARNGIRFTSHYAGSPEDTLSRAALLSGMAPGRTNAGAALPGEAETIAEYLKKLGYHTGFLGIWGLGGQTGPTSPVNQGFVEFGGFFTHEQARDYFADRWWRQDERTQLNDVALIYDNMDRKRGRYMPDLLTTAAVNFLRNNKPDWSNRHRPVFLCLAYPIPHDTVGPDLTPYGTERWPEAQKKRAAMITRMDDGVGQILGALDRLNLQTNTVVLFTSVNGPRKEGEMDPAFFNSAGPLRGMQGSVYEGGLRVPMIVRWPAQIRPGQVSDLPWAAWDILPTAMEIALSTPPKEVDGISVLPTLTGGSQTNRHEQFYWESTGAQPQQAVRMGDWKGVRTNATAALEVYNLRNDIGEKQNVADRNADVAAKLKVLLDRGRANAEPQSN